MVKITKYKTREEKIEDLAPKLKENDLRTFSGKNHDLTRIKKDYRDLTYFVKLCALQKETRTQYFFSDGVLTISTQFNNKYDNLLDLIKAVKEKTLDEEKQYPGAKINLHLWTVEEERKVSAKKVKNLIKRLISHTSYPRHSLGEEQHRENLLTIDIEDTLIRGLTQKEIKEFELLYSKK